MQTQATLTGLLLGLGLGQLVVGPLFDAVGRRRPLLLGLIGHAVMSVLCVLAPSITLLALTRTVQGLAGAAVAVVAIAMVRDLFTGNRAAQLLSRLFLVLGIAPILAPVLGGALLNVTTWQGIFVVLAAAAAALLVLAWFALPETLPPSRRLPASMRASFKAYTNLFTDNAFVILVIVSALLFAVLFAYVAGSPFILQGIYGLSPQQFSLAFGGNAVGLIVATQLNPLLLRRYQPALPPDGRLGDRRRRNCRRGHRQRHRGRHHVEPGPARRPDGPDGSASRQPRLNETAPVPKAAQVSTRADCSSRRRPRLV